MTPSALIQASAHLLVQLATPAARAIVVACAAGFGLMAFRVKATTARLSIWTAVLYAAIAMPLLGWILPPLPVPAPAFLRHAFFNYLPLPNASAQPTLSQSSSSPSGKPQPVAEKRESTKVPNSITLTEERAERYAQLVRSRRNPASPVSSSSVSVPVDTPRDSTPPLTDHVVSIPWTTFSAAIYLTVACLLLLRFFVGLALNRRLLRASQLIDDPRLTVSLGSRARATGLACIPQAAESDLISVPVTLGCLRATILLPDTWREWDDAKLDAVVAHEVSHVARRDALTQRLSLLHRAIFWFSPLAWWLDRHLADLAEQASDEAALSCGADRKHYARTLLEFFEALHAAPGRVWWQGVSMAKAGQAERQAEERVERILSWKGKVAMSPKKSAFKKSLAVAIATLAVPVVYLAASVQPANYSANAQIMHPPAFAQEQTPAPGATVEPPPPAAPATPMPPPAGLNSLAPKASRPPQVGTYSYSAVSPVAPVAPAPPSARSAAWASHSAWSNWAWSSQSPTSATPSASPSRATSMRHRRSYSYAYGDDDDQRFVIASGKSDTLTMSGSSEDAEHVEKLRKTIPGDFLWFQRDEKSYIIRDQATIDRARKLWEPQEELGKKQEALGKQQEALGKQQEELGAKMEQVHVNVPDMTADLDKLKAELKQLSSSATMEQVGHIQSEIGELQSKLGELQSKAGEQQSKLGDQMGALGEKQGKLGEEQGRLGEQQSELAQQASRQMKQLLDEALSKGIAQPEP